MRTKRGIRRHRFMHSTIRNFHQVNSWLYRGGQPTREQIEDLAKKGVRTIVCLRWGQKTIEAEKGAVLASGMDFISVPLYYWRFPTRQDIDTFFNLLDSMPARPVFVHCFHGSDRTGLLLAMYRIARENWTVHEAYREMEKFGFHRFRLRHFKWILFNYAKRHAATRAPMR